MSRLTWTMAGCIALAAVIGCAASGFTVAGLPRLAVVAAALGLAAWHYRRVEPFRLCTSALLVLVLFSSSFVVLTYLTARLAPPLIDEQLTASDAKLGFASARLAAWQERHPAAGILLGGAYDSLLPQTAVTVAMLGLLSRRKPLEAFLRRMMLAATIALGCFLFVEAIGPPGLPTSPFLAHYHDHFLSLRSGLRTGLSLTDTEGIITFPSFHAVWALLLVAACPRALKPLSVLLNAAVIAATVTTGGHYLTDVLAGIVVFYFACWLVPETESAAEVETATERPPAAMIATSS
ncbi:MAG: phosphatase PAP2 family protein [Thermoguttaceae bacterium]